MLNIQANRDNVYSKLDGDVEELIYELTMVNISVINSIIDTAKLKEDKNPLMAKLELVDIISDIIKADMKNGIQKKVVKKENTVNDLIMDAWGLDMDAVQIQLMNLQAIVNKWLPIMEHHKLSKTEMIMFKREIKEAGLTVEEVLDRMIDIKTNKEVK